MMLNLIIKVQNTCASAYGHSLLLNKIVDMFWEKLFIIKDMARQCKSAHGFKINLIIKQNVIMGIVQKYHSDHLYDVNA